MNVLNIGTDKTLVGGRKLGDAIQRHRRYGEFLDHLDIIVYANKKEGLNKFKISDKVFGYPTNSKSKSHFFFDAKKIFEKINQDHKIDIIVCQDPFIPGLIGVCLKKKYGFKLQINFHGDFWQNSAWLKERWLNIFFLLISKFTVPRADLIRVMSEGQKEKLIRAGVKENKIKVISVPVDLDKYQGSEIRDQKLKIVLHVGRDDKVKDYNTLVRAFKLVKEKNPGAIFWQVGANKEIKAAMKKNSFSDIAVIGFKDDKALLPLFTQSAVFVSSSASESFGKVLVEANACGKPVVSTATTGAKEIIQDGVNGFLVPIGDAKALADKIIYLLNNPDKAKEMGENGRLLVKEKYGDNTQKIISAWQELMGEKKNAY